MISLRQLHKSYQTGSTSLHVLRGIDLEVPAGQMMAIMGSSGSGKSTLLNVLGLLDHYDDGEYHLAGRLMRGLSERQAALQRNAHLGFIFQSFHLIPFKTALENVALPLYYKGIRRQQRNRMALEYLEQMGLGPWASHLPTELSGGQQQRVAIARALIGKPGVLLADEPTGALDSQTSIQIMEVLREVNREQGTTLVIVTHEPDIAAMTQRIIHLQDGNIVDDQLLADAAPPSDAPQPVAATAS